MGTDGLRVSVKAEADPADLHGENIVLVGLVMVTALPLKASALCPEGQKSLWLTVTLDNQTTQASWDSKPSRRALGAGR